MTHILIVEDETSFSEALSFLLSKEGFEVSIAETGRTALEIFKVHTFDLILLDLMIPEISGIEVCRAIRATSQVPIIMLTAKDPETCTPASLKFSSLDPRRNTALIRATSSREE
jgi:two-component system response regulator RegX3